MINYAIQITAIAGFIYLLLGFILSMTSKKPQTTTTSTSTPVFIPNESGFSEPSVKDTLIVSFAKNDIQRYWEKQKASVSTMEADIVLYGALAEMLTLAAVPAAIEFPLTVPKRWGSTPEASRQDADLVEAHQKFITQFWATPVPAPVEEIDYQQILYLEDVPAAVGRSAAKAMPKKVTRVTVTPSTPSTATTKQLNAFDLRKLCQRNKIAWRNANGKNKHMTVDAMKTALAQKGVMV